MNVVRLLAALLAIAPLILMVEAAAAQTLRGSRASIDRIHRQALDHQLHFFETATGVRRSASQGTLVQLRGNADYQLAAVTYPYVLPITEVFVTRLARQYRAACGERLVVTSAIRPRSFRLANSVAKSVHPTGMAVDLRRPTNARCLAWLRRTLLALEGNGVLEAVEERSPPHFHIAIFPNPYDRYVRRQGGDVRLASASTGTATAALSSAADGSTYRVRRGDSLWSIARRHGSTVDDLKDANALRSTRIIAGQVLVIPEAR